MAYATTDRLECITPAPLAQPGRVYYHESDDALASVNTAGFITDGGIKGLKVGDYVQHLDTTAATGDLSMHRVLTVGPITDSLSGVIDLTDGTVIAAGANAD